MYDSSTVCVTCNLKSNQSREPAREKARPSCIQGIMAFHYPMNYTCDQAAKFPGFVVRASADVHVSDGRTDVPSAGKHMLEAIE